MRMVKLAVERTPARRDIFHLEYTGEIISKSHMSLSKQTLPTQDCVQDATA